MILTLYFSSLSEIKEVVLFHAQSWNINALTPELPTKSDTIAITLFNNIILELNKTMTGSQEEKKKKALYYKCAEHSSAGENWSVVLTVGHFYNTWRHCLKTYIYARGS